MIIRTIVVPHNRIGEISFAVCLSVSFPVMRDTLTTWLSALDERFTMAAPSCVVTEFIYNLENEEPQDSEQCPPGLLAAGLDMADFFIAQVPRPRLLLGPARDFVDLGGRRAGPVPGSGS